jgi:hypothetical protein
LAIGQNYSLRRKEGTMSASVELAPPLGVSTQSAVALLPRLRDEGVVALETPVRDVLSEVERSMMAPSDRWAIFIISHFIVAAFEW